MIMGDVLVVCVQELVEGMRCHHEQVPCRCYGCNWGVSSAQSFPLGRLWASISTGTFPFSYRQCVT